VENLKMKALGTAGVVGRIIHGAAQEWAIIRTVGVVGYAATCIVMSAP
jgi:hypothetical protein